MRIVFFGSPDFAVPTLRAVHEAGHRILCVVTRPDRPRGRHGTPRPTEVKVAAQELGLDVLSPESANEPWLAEELEKLAPDVGLTIAYGEILKPELLATARHCFLNVHASLLPHYRGAAPINWAVMRGEEQTGVSVLKMTAELDAGPVVGERVVEIGPRETAGELFHRLAARGAELAVEVLERLEAEGELTGRPQPKEAGFFARKLSKKDGRIDWSMPARDVFNRTRGLTPWPGAWCRFFHHERAVRVTLLTVRPVEQGVPEDAKPGTVVGTDGEILVRTGEGAVAIERLKPAGSRAMSAEDFIHGYHVSPGDEFD
jgi:methionyl-tRNA formyltransferase